MLLAGFTLTSCSLAQLFAYRVAENGAVELQWPQDCGGELEELQISASGPAREGEDDDLRVWHIEATDDTAEVPDGSTIRIGEAPEGFDVVVEFDAPLDPAREYHGFADVGDAKRSTGGRWDVRFTPRGLDEDWSDEPYEC